jgi:Asp-tRNA(Asn)/Glu-tRNA(Gln) amidotransferase B subunit
MEIWAVANWMLRDLRETLAALESKSRLPDLRRAGRADDWWIGATTARSARELLPVLVRRRRSRSADARAGLEAVSDAGVIEAAVAAVIAENAENVERYRSGERRC